MKDCPPEMMTIKLATVRSFSQTLRRYTSLNHLAQAARAVLQNQQQISQMLSDLNRVDFANVQVTKLGQSVNSPFSHSVFQSWSLVFIVSIDLRSKPVGCVDVT